MFDPTTYKNSTKKNTKAIFSVVTAKHLKQEWRLAKCRLCPILSVHEAVPEIILRK